MTSIILVESNGYVRQTKVKDISKETLYKKAGFRTSEHFDKETDWVLEINKEIFRVELWAKCEGKANFENKYDFPPPVDNKLYYGSCILIRVDNNGNIINFTSEEWLKIYEKLFGGFDDIISDNESEDEDEDDVGSDTEKTKNGYKKDGFIVSDEESDENEESDNNEEIDNNEDNAGHAANIKHTLHVKSKNIKLSQLENSDSEDYDDNNYGSELEEEAYSYSDEE